MGQGEQAIKDAIGSAEVVRFPGGGGDVDNLELAQKDRNDLGNAERLLARHGEDILYVREVGWHNWTGSHWCPEGAEEFVKQQAHMTAKSIMEEVDAMGKPGAMPEEASKTDWEKKREDLFKWAITSGNKGKLDAMVAEAAPYISVSPEDLDEDRFLLNLKNGTLKLEGACDELRPHRRDDRLAKVMDVEYDPNAECPQWLNFLNVVQPDDEIRQFLQVWSGYNLTGSNEVQKLIFNYGEGGNGKSVFIDLIAKMMGDYAATLPFASLLRDDRKRGSEATPDMARLPGKRLVRASEPEQGARFAEAQIKSITGGEAMPVRHLNQGFFEFDPQFKITLSGNHKPAIRGQDRGIWRRFILVPWEVNVPEEEQDLELPSKLWEERSGILNWLLDGLRIYLERKLHIPDKVKAATDEYRADSDPIGRFISDCVIPSPHDNVKAAEMYEAYCKWCKANAERAFTMTTFGKMLPEKGIEKATGRIRVYMNVRLENIPEASSEPPPAEGPDDYGE